MTLPNATRAALASRFAQVFPGEKLPKTWAEMSMEQRLRWGEVDPEAVAVFSGDMDAALEARALRGELSDEIPEREDEAKISEAEISEAFAQMEQQMVERRQHWHEKKATWGQMTRNPDQQVASMITADVLQRQAVRGR